MTVRRFKQSDITSVNKWLRRHGYPNAQPDTIPATGFIVPGVAVGFVRDCETGVGMIDSYASNSLCSSETRHHALDLITQEILKLPFTHFITMTSDRGLAHRFQVHGLKIMPNYAWLAKVGS